MAKAGIRVDGLNELRRDLRKAKDSELNAEMRKIHKELADEVVAKALPNVPVRTGRLRQSVRSAGTVRDAIGRAGNRTAPYAAVIHWGSPRRNIPRRPFLRDAAEQVERDVVDRYEKAVAKMFDRVLKGR